MQISQVFCLLKFHLFKRFYSISRTDALEQPTCSHSFISFAPILLKLTSDETLWGQTSPNGGETVTTYIRIIIKQSCCLPSFVLGLGPPYSQNKTPGAVSFILFMCFFVWLGEFFFPTGQSPIIHRKVVCILTWTCDRVLQSQHIVKWIGDNNLK